MKIFSITNCDRGNGKFTIHYMDLHEYCLFFVPSGLQRTFFFGKNNSSQICKEVRKRRDTADYGNYYYEREKRKNAHGLVMHKTPIGPITPIGQSHRPTLI